MSDATARFRGRQWEMERAQMLFLAWRLADHALRGLLEGAMRSYARRSATFAAQLKELAQSRALSDDAIVRPASPAAAMGVIAHALASAWSLGDPGFRPDLERAIRQYVRAEPGFRQALASIQWPPPAGQPS